MKKKKNHVLFSSVKDEFCIYCGEKFNEARIKTREHLIPTSKGGNKLMHNVKNACHECNSLKRNMLPQKFLSFIKNKYSLLYKQKSERVLDYTELALLYKYDALLENIKYVIEYTTWMITKVELIKKNNSIKVCESEINNVVL